MQDLDWNRDYWNGMCAFIRNTAADNWNRAQTFLILPRSSSLAYLHHFQSGLSVVDVVGVPVISMPMPSSWSRNRCSSDKNGDDQNMARLIPILNLNQMIQ